MECSSVTVRSGSVTVIRDTVLSQQGMQSLVQFAYHDDVNPVSIVLILNVDAFTDSA